MPGSLQSWLNSNSSSIQRDKRYLISNVFNSLPAGIIKESLRAVADHVVDAYISLTVLARSLSSFLPLQTCLNLIFHSSHNTLFIPGESILGYQPVYENGSKLTLSQLQKCSGKRYYGLLAEERLREYQI